MDALIQDVCLTRVTSCILFNHVRSFRSRLPFTAYPPSSARGSWACCRWNTTGSSTRSTFAVSRNRLYQWPLCYYQRLKAFLVRMGNRGNVEPALYAMERIYNSMFKCFVHNCGESGEECQGNIYCDERTTKLTSSSKIWKRPMKLPARPNDGSFGKADKKAFYGIWRSKTNTFWRRNT